MNPEPTFDGRRARRERSRQAVVDAAFSLILDGKGPPTADAVAERAGVSVSSIFRNFDGLADIQQQALGQFRERFAHLLTATPPDGSTLDQRIAFFVRIRLDLYEQAHPLMAIARMRVLDDDTWVEPINRNRSTLAEQTRISFRAEVDGRSPADAANLIALLDALTSPEVYDLMTKFHARSRRQLSDIWTSGLRSAIAPHTTPERTTTP
ncbi:MAG: TetR/AcrR family transcriptional regulator [Ilumatobacteraceae bacterium]